MSAPSSSVTESSSALAPAATKAATIDPADVPATRLKLTPARMSCSTAPTKPSPFTPPPSSTRSATRGFAVDGTVDGSAIEAMMPSALYSEAQNQIAFLARTADRNEA
jgi:hypothetical protein